VRAKQRAGQFLDRQPRGATLTHDHAAGCIGHEGRYDAVGARSHCQRKGRDHRITGARDVEHFPRLRSDVPGIVRADDAHAFLAARRNDKLEAICRDQFTRSRHDLVVGKYRAADGLAEFLAIGRDCRRPGIVCIVAALRIDQHRLSRVPTDRD
jgi:hypothetical protein